MWWLAENYAGERIPAGNKAEDTASILTATLTAMVLVASGEGEDGVCVCVWCSLKERERGSASDNV